MLDIQLLEKSWFFKETTLEPSEILFDEWDSDNNIYIIKSGEISVEKQLTGSSDMKVLALLKQWKIFWEWALNDTEPKQVRIRANERTVLLSINAKKWMEDFLAQKPNDWLELLKHIIYLWNKRVLKANDQITSTYDINNTILHLENIDNKAIFSLIDTFKNIIRADYVIYLEKNTALEWYYNLRYDTRYQWKILDRVLEIEEEKNIGRVLEAEKIEVSSNNIVEKLHIWDFDIWYFIIWKQTEFEENDKKIIISISGSLSWVIRQKKLLDEERDKNFMNG
jgi:CRP-like cAMP-binding protein